HRQQDHRNHGSGRQGRPARGCLAAGYRPARHTGRRRLAGGHTGGARLTLLPGQAWRVENTQERTMSWIDKILPPRINRNGGDGAGKRVPEGLWVKCPACESVLYKEDLKATLNVCPNCNHHMRIGARARIDALLDEEGRVEIGHNTRPMDPLKFRDTRKYPERISEATKQTGESEAMVV